MSTLIPSSIASRISLSTNGTTHVIQAPSSADVRGELMRITPEMAGDLLKRKLPNRPLSKARVRVMIQDMREDRWHVNGESIILTESLEVIDGQHRLQAIYESGVSITCMVVVGIDPSASLSIDQGRSKVASDFLHMHGMTNAGLLASAARWNCRYERQSMREPGIALRNDQLARYVQSRPGLQGSLAWGRSIRDLLSAAPAAMLFYLMSHKEPAAAKHYFDDLSGGVGLSRDAPAYVVREKLLKDKTPRTHMGIVKRAALVSMGWIAIRSEKPLPASVTWRGADDPTVPFPHIV